MARRLLAAVALALALGACGGGEDASEPPSTASTGASEETRFEPLLASWTGETGGRLFWADGGTLEPVDGRSVEVPFFYSAAEVSPDGTLLALGGGDSAVIQIVDLERMRAVRMIDVGAGEWVERLHWVAPDLLLASLVGARSHAAAIDPEAGRTVHAQELAGMVLESEPAGAGLAFLLAPASGIGEAAVAVFDGDRVRTAALPEIRAGYRSEGETAEDFRTFQAIPGLAVDPAGRRALVVPAGNRVAEVDLATMGVAYHELSQPVSLLGRLRDWLEPEAEAKLIDGPARTAVWLPDGLVAISGTDYATDGGEIVADPAGLSLLDPDNWTVRTISDEPGSVDFREGVLLGSMWDDESARQSVHVFGQEGSARFTLESETADFSARNGLLYLGTGEGHEYQLVSLASGETVGRATLKQPTWLVYLEEP